MIDSVYYLSLSKAKRKIRVETFTSRLFTLNKLQDVAAPSTMLYASSRLDINGCLHLDGVHWNVLIAFTVLAQLEVARMTRMTNQILLVGITIPLATDLVREVMMMSG